ncbi:MAG: hypothetical protein HQK49_15025 [Oligoflexia bacterium]|nr:hypothetical protein [Oligoflexia bacterium]
MSKIFIIISILVIFFFNYNSISNASTEVVSDNSVQTSSELGFRSSRSIDKDENDIDTGNGTDKRYLKQTNDRAQFFSDIKYKFGQEFDDPEVNVGFRAYKKFTTYGEDSAELRTLVLKDKGTYYSSVWGLQFVNWSETFGLNILDIVNPRDFSEFIFEDLSASKIPVWAFKTSILLDKFTIQPIYVPQARNYIVPPKGSFFDPIPKVLDAIVRVPAKDKKIFTDHEYGLKLAYLFSFGLDFSLIYYSYYHRIPVYYLNLSDFKLHLADDKRVTSYGNSFTYSNGGLVLRGDTLFTKEVPYFSNDFIYRISDQWQGIYGLDYTFENQIIIGSQFHFENINENKWISFQIKKSIGNFDLQAMYFTGINNKDLWIRPEITWHFLNIHQIRLYADILSRGSESTSNGNNAVGDSVGNKNGILEYYSKKDQIIFTYSCQF